VKHTDERKKYRRTKTTYGRKENTLKKREMKITYKQKNTLEKQQMNERKRINKTNTLKKQQRNKKKIDIRKKNILENV